MSNYTANHADECTCDLCFCPLDPWNRRIMKRTPEPEHPDRAAQRKHWESMAEL